MVVPKYLPPMPNPYKPWYDVNAKCEFHVWSEGHNTENCIDFQRMGSDNDDVRRSPKTLNASTYQKDVKTPKDIGVVLGLAQSDQISTTRQLKEEFGSSSRKEVPESSKGQPPVMLVHYHQLKFQESISATSVCSSSSSESELHSQSDRSLVFPKKLNPLVTFPPNFKHNAIYSTNEVNNPTSWSYHITTHASGSTKEATNGSEEAAPHEESKREDSKDCHVGVKEHDDLNLWLGKGL
ncbi:hypothetical protein KIW84_031132 [Lathyrus oleraceus]|uniref:Uncharacterized protein n=1 Tax=Pisum sativum TaxID=3888 RepID=A0A9D5B075_PEA|nr:hypothetical protein KIW84_031132 [Pisum sativum]